MASGSLCAQRAAQRTRAAAGEDGHAVAAGRQNRQTGHVVKEAVKLAAEEPQLHKDGNEDEVVLEMEEKGGDGGRGGGEQPW